MTYLLVWQVCMNMGLEKRTLLVTTLILTNREDGLLVSGDY